MLKILQSGNSLPFSFIVDPNAEFQPGMIAQLNTFGNQQVCGVSDGTCPIGIIDDVKTHAFTKPSIDEVLIVTVENPVTSNGQLVTPSDIKVELENPNIIPGSFMTDIDVVLIPRNGVIQIPKGTVLNCDDSGQGVPDSVKVVVSYTYFVPNVPGDDSTAGTGRVTVWFNRIIFETDMFETNQRYAVNSPLFISENGLLTSKQLTPEYSSVAICLAPSTSIHDTIQALWL